MGKIQSSPETVEPQGIYYSHKCNHHKATCATQENPYGASCLLSATCTTASSRFNKKEFKVSTVKTSPFYMLYKLLSLVSHSSFQSSLLQKHSVVFILISYPQVSFPPVYLCHRNLLSPSLPFLLHLYCFCDLPPQLCL